jgi:hypothetical protein
MKKALVLATLLSTAAFAETPYDKFNVIDDATMNAKHFTLESKISWVFTENVNQLCESQAKKHGTKPFNVGNKKMDGCSFWYKDKEGADMCVIITNVKTDYWTLGHEVRHCFHGGFHK